MSEEAVSLATLKQTIQKMFESLQIVKLDGNPEYEQLHRDILKWKRKSKIEVLTCVEKLQKQLQKVAKDKFCQDCHEHGRIQACHFCLYEILGEEKH